MGFDDFECCRKCKRLFKQINKRKYCYNCFTEIEEKMDKIKELLKNQEDISITELVEKFELPKQIIIDYIKENSLIVNNILFSEEDVKHFHKCKSCGCYINTGSYCLSCKRLTFSSMYDMNPIKKSPPSEENKESDMKGKMHFLNRNLH